MLQNLGMRTLHDAASWSAASRRHDLSFFSKHDAFCDGDVFDVEFPLHPDTGSAVRVSGLLSALLETVERDIAVAGATSNGDVLQAMAMALAVRARIIHASPEASTRLARSLVDSALGAMNESDRQPPTIGHA